MNNEQVYGRTWVLSQEIDGAKVIEHLMFKMKEFIRAVEIYPSVNRYVVRMIITEVKER